MSTAKAFHSDTSTILQYGKTLYFVGEVGTGQGMSVFAYSSFIAIENFFRFF